LQAQITAQLVPVGVPCVPGQLLPQGQQPGQAAAVAAGPPQSSLEPMDVTDASVKQPLQAAAAPGHAAAAPAAAMASVLAQPSMYPREHSYLDPAAHMPASQRDMHMEHCKSQWQHYKSFAMQSIIQVPSRQLGWQHQPNGNLPLWCDTSIALFKLQCLMSIIALQNPPNKNKSFLTRRNYSLAL
jgi:hypothetical protein